MKTKKSTLRTIIICAAVLVAVIVPFSTSAKHKSAQSKIQKGQETKNLNKTEKSELSNDISDKKELSLREVMDRILLKQDLDNVSNYKSGTKNKTAEQIVLLCTSKSGKYKAYGFISPEYGNAGILINNIIDGEDNRNYLEETWAYSDIVPTIQEQGKYEVLFTFVQENNGNDSIKKIYFDTYDTGTMSARYQ